MQVHAGDNALKVATMHVPHDFNILFRFSLLFSLSSRFLCIFSANMAYRSRSAFAARLSFNA
jgi:hypothetical protein